MKLYSDQAVIVETSQTTSPEISSLIGWMGKSYAIAFWITRSTTLWYSIKASFERTADYFFWDSDSDQFALRIIQKMISR